MRILLINPPLTQLNTPYPGICSLAGFLRKEGHEVVMYDAGIALFHGIYNEPMLKQVFDIAEKQLTVKSSNFVRKIIAQKQIYLRKIDEIILFLTGKNDVLAHRICNTGYLPQSYRELPEEEVDWAFGKLGTTEMAKYYATLFLEDIGDVVQLVFPHLGLNRYGEHLCLRLPELDPLIEAVNNSHPLLDNLLNSLVRDQIQSFSPEIVGISIPFPGTLFGAMQCSNAIRAVDSKIKIVWGGGYVSTELRDLSDNRILNYADYIVLDDGESAFPSIIRHLSDWTFESVPYHCFYSNDKHELTYSEGKIADYRSFKSLSEPDYRSLDLTQYINTIELLNPMNRLWSDGRWIKLTLARGCYWGKCAFCDTSLPYINNYEPKEASQLVDEIEYLIAQTGQRGFHFTDEAAPPKLLREIADELIRRGVVISWWTNVRFEKAYTYELCEILAASGCIAIAGGLEVASDHLLKKMSKGVQVEQAAESCKNFTDVGIMVHAYLMYAFPGETIQDVVNSLETVRRFYEAGYIQSSFWHRYAMTMHSPSGMNPSVYGAKHLECPKGKFANNEIAFTDHQEIDWETLGIGLYKANYNYMHGLCLDWPMQKWFMNKVPKPNITLTI